jgi:diguanylate cyclase (GGDEF)-like protein
MVLRAVNKKARHMALSLGIVACTLFACALYWGTMNARSGDLRDADVAVQNMANALAKQANSSFRIAQAMLNSVSDVSHREAHLYGSLSTLEKFQNQAGIFEEIDTVALFNTQGILVNSWPASKSVKWNVSNEDFFHNATRREINHLAIGSPIRSAVSGEMIIPAYKTFYVDGHRGVAMVGLKLSYFQALFNSFDIKKQGALVLASDEGVMLLRRPYDVQFLGKSMADAKIFSDFASKSDAGWATIVSSQDGVKRINYFQHVQGYPLFVVAALSHDEVLADWRRINDFILALAFGAVAAIAILVFFLQKLLRFKEKAEREIDEVNRALADTNEKLAEQAFLDGLTGIANRRSLDDETKKAIQATSRSSSPIGLVMVDVDHFKKFNDIYGHIQGDYCLKDIGGVLKSMQKRSGDLAGRYGGEEFLILLPNTDLHGTYKVAEDVLEAIRLLQIPHRGNPSGCVTVSAGVTSFIPTSSTTAEELYSYADRGLYAAKNSGRDKVCDSNSPIASNENQLNDGR